MKRKCLIVFGLVVALFLTSAQALAAPEAQRLDVTGQHIESVLHNDWFGIYAENQKIGFMQDAFEKVTNKGKTIYRVSLQAQMKLVALGEKGEVKIEQRLDFDSRAPFAMVGGVLSADDGRSIKRISVERTDTGFEATISIGKVTQKKQIGRLDFTMADVVSPNVWLKNGPARHTSIACRDFSFENLNLSTIAYKLLDTRQIVEGGAKSTVFVVEKAEHHAHATVTSTIHFDRNTRMLSGQIAGMFEFRRESEAEARKIQFGNDLIFANMVKLDRPMGDLKQVTGLTLKGQGKVNGLIRDTALQSITHEGNDVYVLKIGKQHGQKIRATAQEIKEALEPSAAYPTQDAQVRELAKRVVGDAKTDQEKVNRLCKFVHEYIKYEIVYMPKVHDILERKVGDCKSYALLFCTLARAAGVPTREASGYVYMGDEVKGFGGHAWNEVVIDGHWLPIDATAGHTDLAPLYICVGVGRDGNDNMSQTSGKLSFQLVEVERVQ
jgi:hypothetical protein